MLKRKENKNMHSIHSIEPVSKNQADNNHKSESKRHDIHKNQRISLYRDISKDDFKTHSEHNHSHHRKYHKVHHKKHEFDSSNSTSFPHLIYKNRVSLQFHKKKSIKKKRF